MALTHNIDLANGLAAPNSYIKVSSVHMTKINGTAVVSFHAQQDKAAFQSKSYFFDYDLNAANPIKQAYSHLKTLPEFAGATDC